MDFGLLDDAISLVRRHPDTYVATAEGNGPWLRVMTAIQVLADLRQGRGRY